MNEGPAAMQANASTSIDAELVALDAPARTRHLATMLALSASMLAALFTLYFVRADLSYFFAPAETIDMGEATTLDPAALESNSYVHVRGTPMMSLAVRSSMFLGSEEIVVFPLAGQRAVFVQVPFALFEHRTEGTRRDFTGRLVRFGDLAGRFATVRTTLGKQLGTPITGESYLLIADEAPGANPIPLALAIFCAAIVVTNGMILWRWFRPIPLKA